jgi:hypothetical protein
MACVENCDNPDISKRKHFEQPIWQTLNMFLGETLCLVAASIFAYLAEKYGRAKWAELFLDDEEEVPAVVESDGLISHPPGHGHGHGAQAEKKKLEGVYVLLLWLPTICDMTASTVSNQNPRTPLLSNGGIPCFPCAESRGKEQGELCWNLISY